MSRNEEKMLDRYVHLDCFGNIQQIKFDKDKEGNNCWNYLSDEARLAQSRTISISTKLDDEGVVIDVWCNDECVASTYKLYSEMGVEVKEVEDE